MTLLKNQIKILLARYLKNYSSFGLDIWYMHIDLGWVVDYLSNFWANSMKFWQIYGLLQFLVIFDIETKVTLLAIHIYLEKYLSWGLDIR